MEAFFENIKQHVPEQAMPILKKWFTPNPFRLTVTKTRTTKLGDYRAPNKHFPHRISVNQNLNKYAFLITLTHEFAHLLVYEKYKNNILPHGLEWKNQYAALIITLLENNIFTDEIAAVLVEHIKNPAASSCRDFNLTLELKKHDIGESTIHLIDLPEGAVFALKNKRVFIKGKKRRTRYFCQENSSRKQYLIHGAAEVLVVE
ncbi:MAG: SprT-like domain-containing protein [Bacteroidetes bacterium]|nr:SprT-like domain-containing protein [Bacteroidota bacterium]